MKISTIKYNINKSKKNNKSNLYKKHNKTNLYKKHNKNNLYKKHNKTKLYNLYGGSKKLALNNFIDNYKIILDNLMKEKKIFADLEINTNFTLPQLNSPTISTEIKIMFDKLVKALTIITKNFIIDNSIEGFNMSKIDKETETFINDNIILWIIKCYTSKNFYLDEKDLDSNLLLTTYKSFLELYFNLKYLIDNRKIIYDNNKLKTKEKLGNLEENLRKEEKLKYIYENIKKDFKLLNMFNSLLELKLFIDDFQKEISEIKIANKYIELKKTGKEQGNVEIDLETPKLYIYKILSKAGSLYYGSDTTWCTSSASFFNKYDTYKDNGPLYIIQDKHNKSHKYQMQIKTGQLRNNSDKQVSISELLYSFDNDPELKRYFENLKAEFDKITFPDFLDFKYFKKDSKAIINIRSLFYDFIYEKYNYNNFNIFLKNYLKEIDNLKHLVFGAMFNQPIDNLLDNFTDLESLTFGDKFNQPLHNSLDNLVNLESLSFGESFNQPLDFLTKLLNLKKLTINDKEYDPKTI